MSKRRRSCREINLLTELVYFHFDNRRLRLDSLHFNIPRPGAAPWTSLQGVPPCTPTLLATLCSPRGCARRSRLGAAARKGSPGREAGGWGALSLLPDVVELATIEHGVRADSPSASCSTFTFAWYALTARTRPLEPPWTPPALASAGVVHRLARIGLEGPLLVHISQSRLLAVASLHALQR